MPRIPTVTTEVSAKTLRSNAALPQTRASGDDFGAQIGRALGDVAVGIDRLGAGLQAYHEKKRSETVANAVAQSDFTQREMAIRNEVGPDGAGYYDRVREEYLAFVDAEADKIEDNMARTEYRNRMLQQLPGISSRSATYEASIAATHSKEQANASLMALQNKVMVDPTLYDTYLQQGFDVIDTRSDVNATIREGMKEQWRTDLARMRFEGMLENAKSVAELDAIAGELTGIGAQGQTDGEVDWTSQFTPEDYRRMVNDIGTARSAFVTRADADARAALDTLTDRSNDVSALIPQEELEAVQLLVRQSENPITAARMARILRNEEIKKQSRTLTPAELRAQINAANGNPGLAYPGVPPRLSTAINDTVQRFDVSASFLGNLAHREYGQYLGTGTPVRGNQQFMPVATHGNVDLRNIRSDVLDAAMVAGELFGAPLQLNSGFRSQQHQDNIRASGDPNRVTVARDSHHTSGTAIDISTVGMSAADQGRLVASLVDAGFTGIGQYGTHIHVDFRAAVPSSFRTNEDGTAWGGWTNLSPEVTAELVRRGYAGGLSASQIQRARPVTYADDIDYTQGTSVTGADGQPVTSATGVAQFTSGTFLEVMRKPGVAARMGIDISAMTEAQLLDLRKDPNVSMMAAAAYAEQNKIALQSALGRPINDAELYMAHMLGPGGAIALIGGVKNNPNAAAADLLPQAASNNRSVFYENGRPLTAQQVYNRIAVSFDTSQSQVTFGDNQTRQQILTNMERNLTNDPVTHAQTTGTFVITPLDASQGFAMRGSEARAIADYYNIPLEGMKPFTEDEANSLAKGLKDGSVDDALQIMSAIQDMGPQMARAAIAQLGEKEPVYAYAAGLQANNGGYAASDIVRGQKRLEENPSIKDGLGATDRDMYDAFVRATGGSLYELAPDQRQAIQNAALAHYIETVVARGRAQNFDEGLFTASVQAVMGGTQGRPAIDNVNGQPTVLPQGLTGSDMETAFQRMTVDDWTRLSVDKLPPRYLNGDVIAPDDLAGEAMMRAVGNGHYKIMLGDGSFAVTGEMGQNGRLNAYVFVPTAEEIQRIGQRPVPDRTWSMTPPPERDELVDQDGYLSLDEQTRLREMYGPLWAFDEYGRWLGPVEGQQ